MKTFCKGTPTVKIGFFHIAAAEVEADTSLLLLNLADMIDSRVKGCEAVNDMYGTNWSVHIAEEIDYGTENEPEEVTENV